MSDKPLVDQGDRRRLSSRRHPARWLAALGGVLLFACVGHAFRQEQLNQALIRAILSNEDDVAITALQQGADARTLYFRDTLTSWWKKIVTVFSGRRGSKTPGTSLLVLTMDTPLKEQGFHPLRYSPALFDLMKTLAEKGAPVNVRGTMGTTPLEFAISHDHYDLAMCLCDHGADTRIPSFADVPILDRAIIYPDIRFVKLIIDRGADVNVRDKFGERPLDWAREANRSDVVKLLKAHHAKEASAP